MLLFAAIPSIYLHRDAHYLAKRKVYIFNLMIPLCGSWAGFGEILIWGFRGVSFCKYYSFNKTSRRGGPSKSVITTLFASFILDLVILIGANEIFPTPRPRRILVLDSIIFRDMKRLVSRHQHTL